MNTAILEMNNESWHALSSLGITKQNVKIDSKRSLVFVKCTNKEAGTIKSLIDSATIIKV